MLTTECNAEPFVHCFDGYLTWHWQHDGQVPAFPAVYGGAIQMFGRAYRGGPTKDLALRMKAAQQLVFGEQIGWLAPDMVLSAKEKPAPKPSLPAVLEPAGGVEKSNAEFFREVVRLRWALKRYFYAGEMARPPKLLGDIPKVTADWQWSGQWPVTTDALFSGAWIQPDRQKLVLLFANVADQPLRVRLEFDASQYGLTGSKFRWIRHPAAGPQESVHQPAAFQQELSFSARDVCAWECSPLNE